MPIKQKKFIAQFTLENRFLSNFYICPEKIPYNFDPEKLANNWEFFPSVENAYQAAKTEDKDVRIKIAKSTPFEAKKIGNKVKIIDNWEKIKKTIMYRLLLEKFSQKEMKEKLLNTGNSILIEGNWWGDNYWGASIFNKEEYGMKDISICDDTLLFLSSPWSTGNQLGKLLMFIREKIRLEEAIF